MGTDSSNANNDIASSFRAKATAMKSWKPNSNPSNRDRLELYALHKQAVNGDAPSTFSNTASGPEKAKYQAWKSKNGMSSEEAMRNYLQECDRQMRVYGTTPQTPHTTPNVRNASNSPNSGGNGTTVPRGLAAIPLLCAAALESRPAYIRRLAQTPQESAWWRRQEPLCAPPGNIGALPEMLVLVLARIVEYISLAANPRHRGGGGGHGGGMPPLLLPAPFIQAFLWPVHNSLLSIWMGVVLVHTLVTSAGAVLQTIIWGARRTGISLSRVWNDQIALCATSITNMCEDHQAVSCRVVGLVLWPMPYVIQLLGLGTIGMNAVRGVGGGGNNNNSNTNTNNGGGVGTLTCTMYCTFLIATWWYWLLVVPWLASCLLGTAISTGFCFFVIEMAGI